MEAEFTTVHHIIDVGWRITHTCGPNSASTIVNYVDFDSRGQVALDEAIEFVKQSARNGYNALPPQ